MGETQKGISERVDVMKEECGTDVSEYAIWDRV